MTTSNASDEDWELLSSLFPPDWKASASKTGALKGLRQDKSEENYLRILLMHLGCGYSLRETAVRARQAGLADLSDVALLKRLRKAKGWLNELCLGLFAERGLKCTDCHYALNNPVHYQESGDNQLSHLLYDPRRLEIGEYIERPDHTLARGQSAQISVAPESAAA